MLESSKGENLIRKAEFNATGGTPIGFRLLITIMVVIFVSISPLTIPVAQVR